MLIVNAPPYRLFSAVSVRNRAVKKAMPCTAFGARDAGGKRTGSVVAVAINSILAQKCRERQTRVASMPSVLVTGASRGIGNAIAERLLVRGWHVVAGVRTDADAKRLADMHPHLSTVILDITNSEHIAALHDSLPERLDAVVNNAGVVVGGAMEALSIDELRRQVDVNLVGPVAVTQAVLPRLRSSRGPIVFVSSATGRVATPLIGVYCASKFALEAAADALRMELCTWGIRVVVVQPAQTDTDIWRTADTQLEETAAAVAPQMRELYDRHISGYRKAVRRSQKTAVPAQNVAAVVEKALTTRRPRARYVVGMAAKVQVAVITRMPTRVRDYLLNVVSAQPIKSQKVSAFR
jgi:NAD(P)-dependent dehydrogenase (short-subunit alcohol dehydrogenase family)